MQMYPAGGYNVVDEEDYLCTDDCQYNNAFSHQAMRMKPGQWIPPPKHNRRWEYPGKDDDEDPCKNGSSMQMMAGQWIPPPKHNRKWEFCGEDDEYRYKNGSTMQMKPDQWTSPEKHNYNHMQGYGGHDYDYDSFEHGRGNAQYSEGWYEIGQYNDAWNSRNGYPPGHGKHHNANKYPSGVAWDFEISGGYGAPRGSRMPFGEHHTHYPEQTKGKPLWHAKGIID